MNQSFQVGREVGNNFNNSFTRVKDENAIDKILAEAMGTKNPEIIQNSIGQILSQVSPERQGMAMQYLQNTYANIQKKEEQAKIEKKEKEAATQSGYTYGAPPAVQAEQVKNKGKQARLDQRFGSSTTKGDIQQPENGQNYITPIPSQNPINPFANSSNDQLILDAGSPDREISEPAKAMLKQRQKDETEKRADTRESRKETAPLKKAIIEKADLSRESIRNKTQLLELIDKGNLDDPSFALFASSLPYNMGKRLLSEDTVTYKSGLVDEFSDLKNIFKGATRVKEVEIYEDKLADIYLTDGQKKAILKSRINTAKVDLIREDAAAEVELNHPNLSALQFNKMVDKVAKPQIDALFNSIWDEQKSIFDQAEKRKSLQLDPNDPDDLQIIDAILLEAKGNHKEAEKVAKKKGYKFK